MLSARTVRGGARVALVVAGCAVAVAALAGTAFAHITVTPGSAPQGSATELTFRVPDEEAKAATVEIQLKIPTSPPIAQLLVKPVPGWQIAVQTITLAKPLVTDDGSFSTAVSEVTWSGGTILPGQYQDFSVSADPLPTGVGQLAFKAIQTYSNGDIVRWIDIAQPGQPAPDHLAPVLTLTVPGASGDTSGAGQAPAATGSDTSMTAIALGAAGLAAGLLGFAAGLVAWRRGRPDDRGGRPGDLLPGAAHKQRVRR
jgi:uncharacterized protein YcnI